MSIYEWSRARWLTLAAILLALFATYHVFRASFGWFEPKPGKPWPAAAQAKILADCELSSDRRCRHLLDAWMSEYTIKEVRAMDPHERWRAAERVAATL